MEQLVILKSELIHKRYKVEHTIDRGSCATVYLGTDNLTKKKVAIKVERADAPRQTIPHESRVYLHINNWEGFPRMLFGGPEKCFNILVMEILGASLKHIFYDLGKQFSLKTILQLADQMLLRIQTLHGLNFIHCDLKPDNFVTGAGDKSGQVYLIDFGMARQYIHENQHVPSHPYAPRFVGSPAFASCNAHLYRKLSRRDDLESLGYVLLYFAKGTLPWLNSSMETIAEQFWHIQRIKLGTSIEELCEGVLPEFMDYLKYVRGLRYDQAPDYNYLRALFRNVAVKYGYIYDRVFEWHKPNTVNV